MDGTWSPGLSSQLPYVDPEGYRLVASLPVHPSPSLTVPRPLEVPCSTGFGVGHTRQTQTKGIWLWKSEDTLPLLFVDTEGFESTGSSTAYDDRIFALATILSHTLIYNLPEAVRETDLEKLSFSSQLARAFGSEVSLHMVGIVVVVGRSLARSSRAPTL